MVNRISTFAFYNMLSINNQFLQKQYNETQVQISSGLQSQDFKGIAFNSNLLLTLEADRDRVEAYEKNIVTVEATYNLQNSALSQIIDRVSSFKTDIAAALGVPPNPGTDSAFVATATQDYNDFIGVLNLQIGSEYIFSGTTVDTRPVDITDPGYAGPFTPPTAVNTNYYQGNNDTINVPVGDSLTVNVGISAAESGFEKAMRAFNLVIDNPGDNVAREEAFALLDEAIGEIIAIRSRLSANASTLEDQKVFLSEKQSFVENSIADIREVDITEATLRSQRLAAQLEASYAVTVRALNLNLSDFLR